MHLNLMPILLWSSPQKHRSQKKFEWKLILRFSHRIATIKLNEKNTKFVNYLSVHSTLNQSKKSTPCGWFIYIRQRVLLRALYTTTQFHSITQFCYFHNAEIDSLDKFPVRNQSEIVLNVKIECVQPISDSSIGWQIKNEPHIQSNELNEMWLVTLNWCTKLHIISITVHYPVFCLRLLIISD